MILIAKCRVGYPCRYHGCPVRSPQLIKKIKNLPYLLVCPECESGLPTPRPPIYVEDGQFFLGRGKDITCLLLQYCEQKIIKLQQLKIEKFIGVKGSPCCDPKKGLFAYYLRKIGIKSRLQL